MAFTPFTENDIPSMKTFNEKFQAIMDSATAINRNLIDNAYFGNPVDQRGGYVVPPNTPYYDGGSLVGNTTAYTKVDYFDVVDGVAYPYITVNGASYVAEKSAPVRGYTGAGYTIDRWMLTGSDATGATHLLVNDDSVTYEGAGNSNLSEIVDRKLSGKTVTCSVLCEAVTNCMMILRNTDTWVPIGAVVVDAPGLHSFTATIPDDYDLDTVRLTFSAGSQGEEVAHSITIKAAKLELGTQQTLAHQENGVWVLNEIPNYAEELAKCQRYQAVFGSDTYTAVGVGVGRTLGEPGDIFTSIPLPVSLRAVPNVSISGIVTGRNDGVYLNAGGTGEIIASPGGLMVGFVVEGVISGAPYDMFLPPNNKLILDANL